MTTKHKELALFGESFAKAEQKSDETIWHVFVQILLPLVLILTFVSVLDILKYKDVAINERDNAKFYRSKIGELDPKQEFRKYKVTLIELQFLSLLKNLEEIKQKKLLELKLMQVSSAMGINLLGTKIEDPLFKQMCGRTFAFLQPNNRQRNQNNIYKAVLVHDVNRKFQDPKGLRLNVRHWNDIDDTNEDPLRANLANVTSRNRKRIHNSIVEFFDSTKKQVILLQTELLYRIFEELIVNPEQLDDTSRKIVEELIAEKDEKRRNMLANRFYLRIISRWNEKLNDQGYVFLTGTWNNFKYLH